MPNKPSASPKPEASKRLRARMPTDDDAIHNEDSESLVACPAPSHPRPARLLATLSQRQWTPKAKPIFTYAPFVESYGDPDCNDPNVSVLYDNKLANRISVSPINRTPMGKRRGTGLGTVVALSTLPDPSTFIVSEDVVATPSISGTPLKSPIAFKLPSSNDKLLSITLSWKRRKSSKKRIDKLQQRTQKRLTLRCGTLPLAGSKINTIEDNIVKEEQNSDPKNFILTIKPKNGSVLNKKASFSRTNTTYRFGKED